jgi:hypothetical protein
MTENANMNYNRQSNYCQAVLLDNNGYIQDSCDSLFDSSLFNNKVIGNYFYFLASELPTIWASEANKISYNRMQTTQECLPGFYDFVFSKIVVNGNVHILWEIFDYTNVYKEYIKIQQIKNEVSIHEQFLLRNKNQSLNSNGAHSQNFFQSEYIAKQRQESDNLVYRLIHNEKGADNNPAKKGLTELNELKNHLELMIKEIDRFLVKIKEDEVKEVKIKDVVDNYFHDEGSVHSDKMKIIYNDNLPNSVGINKEVLTQIISLVCKDEFNHVNPKSASLSLGLLQDNDNANPVLTVDYVEQLSLDFNLNEDSAKRVIKLSILKSLVTTLGGKLISKYSTDNHIFGALISLPLKNC